MDLVALRPLALDTLVWHTEDGVYHLTVIAKVTFSLESGEVLEPSPIIDEDRAPQKPRADVLFFGSAHTLVPKSSHDVRIAVERSERGVTVPLVDKTLRIVGEQTGPGEPQPFTTLPLRYQYALGGATSKTNPIGIGADPEDKRRPRIIDAKFPKRTNGVGPVPRTWWWRSRALAGNDPGSIDALRNIPSSIDWSYFNAAPPDQQCAFLLGDESIVLEGLHPRDAKVQARLPAIRAHVLFDARGSRTPPIEIPLVADALAIEGDALRASLTFRGSIRIEDERVEGRVFATLAAIGDEPIWASGEGEEDAARSVRMRIPSDVAKSGPVSRQRDSLPAPPKRTTERVPILSRTAMIPFTRMWQLQPPQDTCVVIVKGTFDMVDDGPATLAGQQQPPLGDHPHDDGGSPRYSSDFAPFKPFADVLLVGHAYAGGDSKVGHVNLQLGSIDRSIAVFGDRAWEAFGAQGEPTPFEKMPLRWERAMGGPLSARNPVGRGFKTGLVAPNLERPDALVRSPDDSPAPACFAPIAPEWRPRASKLGTYGARWLTKLWPFFPDDFDWSYFNAAPAEQQLPYLEGNERYSIKGVIPGGGMLAGRLPSVRPRVFAQKTAAAGADFFEVLLRIDTVWFDADARAMVVVWRGLIEVVDDEASEIASLFAIDEALEKATSVDDAHTRFFAELAAATPAEALPEPANDPVAAFEATARAAPPPMSRADALAAIAAKTSLSGVDLTGVDLEGADLAGANFDGALMSGAILRGARLNGASLVETNLARCDAEGAVFEGAKLELADLHGSTLERASFVGADLGRADFGAAHAAFADFTGARAASASFVGTNLVSSRFPKAELLRANLTGATLDEANFEDAKLDDAKFYETTGERVRFDRTSLVDARFDRCSLPRASFLSATGAAPTFESAMLEDATFQEAKLHSASFARAKLARVIFSKGDFREATFRKADLRGASLLRTNLMQASFEGADLRKADLRGSNLFQSETWKAKTEGADLAQAILDGTKLA